MRTSFARSCLEFLFGHHLTPLGRSYLFAFKKIKSYCQPIDPVTPLSVQKSLFRSGKHVSLTLQSLKVRGKLFFSLGEGLHDKGLTLQSQSLLLEFLFFYCIILNLLVSILHTMRLSGLAHNSAVLLRGYLGHLQFRRWKTLAPKWVECPVSQILEVACAHTHAPSLSWSACYDSGWNICLGGRQL